MYDMKELYEAFSIKEAIELRLAHPEAQIIAGGSDVLVQMREGKRAGKELISIYLINELRGVSLDENSAIRIGSLTNFSHITRDPIIQKYINVLGEAVDLVGGPQIRNIGTIGGNTCNGVTSADTATTLLNLEAELTLTSPAGERRVNVNDYYLGAGRVCLDHAELLTDICVKPENYQGFGGCYIKYAMRNAMDIATLGTSCLVKPGKGGVIDALRLAFGVAAPVPMRARNTEQALTGKSYAEALEEIAGLVRGEITPRTSWRASREFRLQIAGENARRALESAWAEAGGEV